MAVMGVVAAARALGVGPAAVRKAIARGTLKATLISGGRLGERGRLGVEYAITETEVDRYRRENLRPGHRRLTGVIAAYWPPRR